MRLTTVPGLIEVLRRPLADMPRELELVPLPGPFDVIVRPPGSKSLTNRVLLLAALAKGESEIRGALLDADDAVVMIGALKQLGAGIAVEERAAGGPVVRVRGTGGKLKGGCTLNLKNAGTATRFLTAAACLADGPVVIDGNERMRQRPIGELVEMLRSLGVTIDELGAAGCVPLRVHPAKLKGGQLAVGTTRSGQYVSALLLIAPWMDEGLELVEQSELTSESYIHMTFRLIARLCYPDEPLDLSVYRWDGTICVNPTEVRGFQYDVETDASSATYFWAGAAAHRASKSAVRGIQRRSLQGDVFLTGVLQAMMGLSPGDGFVVEGNDTLSVYGGPRLDSTNADMKDAPDAAMTLAAVACFATGTTTITGLRTLRVKETDRLEAIRAELTKLGVKVEVFQTERGEEHRSESGATHGQDEGLRITPPEGGIDCSASAPRVEFDTYDDHRMAMSLALIGLRRPNVVIRDPGCVAKTYPTFWNDWAMLYESASAGGAIRSYCG